jgi:hypothetical protein
VFPLAAGSASPATFPISISAKNKKRAAPCLARLLFYFLFSIFSFLFSIGLDPPSSAAPAAFISSSLPPFLPSSC